MSSSASSRAAFDALLSDSFDLQHSNCPGPSAGAAERRAVRFSSCKEVPPGFGAHTSRKPSPDGCEHNDAPMHTCTAPVLDT